MKLHLVIAEIHGQYSANRFRIIEKVTTIDGPRDRITSRTFATLDEAKNFISINTVELPPLPPESE